MIIKCYLYYKYQNWLKKWSKSGALNSSDNQVLSYILQTFTTCNEQNNLLLLTGSQTFINLKSTRMQNLQNFVNLQKYFTNFSCLPDSAIAV